MARKGHRSGTLAWTTLLPPSLIFSNSTNGCASKLWMYNTTSYDLIESEVNRPFSFVFIVCDVVVLSYSAMSSVELCHTFSFSTHPK